jgi:Asp-tRNA(Asn)/Glu-tRNA(Gln) amidotransferase A subunit family amidase
MDKERAECADKEKLPLLHGIPFSIKDVCEQKGFLTTVGCAFLCDENLRAKEDSVVVW